MKTAVQNLYQNLIEIPEVMNLPMNLIQKITSEFNDAHNEEKIQIEFSFKAGLNSDCMQEQNEDFFAHEFYNKNFKP